MNSIIHYLLIQNQYLLQIFADFFIIFSFIVRVHNKRNLLADYFIPVQPDFGHISC